MAFPPHDHNKYRWVAAGSDEPGLFRRYAAGCERFMDFQHRYLNGQMNISFGVDLSLISPLPTSQLLDTLRKAWISLRFDIPTIAAGTIQDGDDDTVMLYRAAKGKEDVDAWAERTVQTVDAATTDEALERIGVRRLPDENGDQTFLYLFPRSGSEAIAARDTEYTLVLYTHHTPFDGAGVKVLMSRFLAILARYIGNNELAAREHDALKWGEEGKNLLPACPQIVAESEALEGPRYEQTLGGIMTDIAMNMPVSASHSVRWEIGAQI
jgi:hypothetical protein